MIVAFEWTISLKRLGTIIRLFFRYKYATIMLILQPDPSFVIPYEKEKLTRSVEISYHAYGRTSRLAERRCLRENSSSYDNLLNNVKEHISVYKKATAISPLLIKITLTKILDQYKTFNFESQLSVTYFPE